jgi:hypothetical protein
MPPWTIGNDSLFVAYYASAEIGCCLVLGWPKPTRVLDLFTEFRCLTNGLPVPAGNGLLGALTFHGLDGIGAIEKEEMRNLVLRGGPWTQEERNAVLDYCQSDVDALVRLLPKMVDQIDLPRALLRGRYMAAAAVIEHNGVPIDVPMLNRLRGCWTDIQDRLIAEIDRDYSVFDGRRFKQDRFAAWLQRSGIHWPRLISGRLDLKDDTFRQMAKLHPAVSPLRELRSSLAELRLSDLSVGPDGRNRCLLSAFRASSGRNAPSNSKSIFGQSVWLRGLIRPPLGHGVAYIDWSAQEFAIAAALSGDRNMIEAYQSGDPYLWFAQHAGEGIEKRELFKQACLATAYGQGAEGLAARIGQSMAVARELLRLHRTTYANFWKWSDATVDSAMLSGRLQTCFGWQVCTTATSNPRSLRNFPMQSHGAEMLRLACCLTTEVGIEVCAPIHDALLVCAPLNKLEADVAHTRALMAEASRVVLNGVELRTSAKITRYPERYQDPRGAVMWSRVCDLASTEVLKWNGMKISA